MSASKEKKTRQQQASSGQSDPKTAREAKQRKEEKKSNLLYGLLAVLFVVVAVVSITWKSGVVQRSAPAVTINGTSYSAAEVQYYYQSVYQNFAGQYSSYLSYFGLDTSKDLKTQACQMDTDGGTWYDYFLKQGLQQMGNIHALCDAADKDGFTWNDEMQTTYDNTIKSLESSRDTYNTSSGASLSTADYLKAVYGKLMTMGVYEKQVKLNILAQAYSNNYVTGLTYTTDQLTAAYKENPNSYDAVDYESVKVDGSVQTKADETAADASASASASAAASSAAEPTDEEKAAAMENAKVLADSILTSYKGGGNLSALADTDEIATYTDGEGGTYTDNILMNWLFDDTRKAGDSAVLEDTDSSVYYVVVFGSRYRYDYNTVNVRHILFQPEEGTIAEGQDGYDDEQAKLKAAARQKADDLLAQWKAGDATEDSFSALAKENSADTGTADSGGLISQISKATNLVQPFLDWCFEDHKPGDAGVIDTDYGSHVMYFVGTDLPYWQVQVTNTLKNNDYSDWYTKTTDGYDAEQNSFGIRFVG